jgi:hypothetical protein
MKSISIAAAGLSVALIALTLVPSAAEYRGYFAIGALVCAALALATIAAGWRDRPAAGAVVRAPEPPAATPPPTVAAPPSKPISADADVVGFLAVLQEKGRLVDFLQDDIAAYSDAQVGAAARVVHQGCKAVLNDYFRIVPVRSESEGAKVAVPAEYVADEYRLVGKISGQAPFAGTLMHRGWKAESVSLPRVLRAENERLPTIAPAEVELR